MLTTHFHLSIKVDFDQNSLIGSNTLNLTAQADGVTQLVLDFQGININNVQEVDDKGVFQTSTYTSVSGRFGNALIITLRKTLANMTQTAVRVTYNTTSEARAMNWLTKEQTATKKLKYLFTQCEPIECRSVAPFQDTPSIKSTYSSDVTVLQPYIVKMSANETAPVNNTDGTTTFFFRNDIKMPSYLVAIAVGNLAVKPAGPRATIIAEPGVDVLDFYANEL